MDVEASGDLDDADHGRVLGHADTVEKVLTHRKHRVDNRYMESEYQARALAEATEKATAARIALDKASTRRSRRDAAEDLEFWTNRKAFLTGSSRR